MAAFLLHNLNARLWNLGNKIYYWYFHGKWCISIAHAWGNREKEGNESDADKKFVLAVMEQWSRGQSRPGCRANFEHEKIAPILIEKSTGFKVGVHLYCCASHSGVVKTSAACQVILGCACLSTWAPHPPLWRLGEKEFTADFSEVLTAVTQQETGWIAVAWRQCPHAATGDGNNAAVHVASTNAWPCTKRREE